MADLDRRIAETDGDLADLRERVAALDAQAEDSQQEIDVLAEQAPTCARGSASIASAARRCTRKWPSAARRSAGWNARSRHSDSALAAGREAAGGAAEAQVQALHARLQTGDREMRDHEARRQQLQERRAAAKVALAQVEERLTALRAKHQQIEADLAQRRQERDQASSTSPPAGLA